MFSCKFCEISNNTFIEHLWWLLLFMVSILFATSVPLLREAELALAQIKSSLDESYEPYAYKALCSQHHTCLFSY